MDLNLRKSYFNYLNKAEDGYNICHCFLLVKILLMLIILLCLKQLRRILNHRNLKIVTESGLLSILRTIIFLAKATQEIGRKIVYNSAHWGISPLLLENIPPPFFSSPHLNLQHVQVPLYCFL